MQQLNDPGVRKRTELAGFTIGFHGCYGLVRFIGDPVMPGGHYTNGHGNNQRRV